MTLLLHMGFASVPRTYTRSTSPPGRSERGVTVRSTCPRRLRTKPHVVVDFSFTNAPARSVAEYGIVQSWPRGVRRTLLCGLSTGWISCDNWHPCAGRRYVAASEDKNLSLHNLDDHSWIKFLKMGSSPYAR